MLHRAGETPHPAEAELAPEQLAVIAPEHLEEAWHKNFFIFATAITPAGKQLSVASFGAEGHPRDVKKLEEDAFLLRERIALEQERQFLGCGQVSPNVEYRRAVKRVPAGMATAPNPLIEFDRGFIDQVSVLLQKAKEQVCAMPAGGYVEWIKASRAHPSYPVHKRCVHVRLDTAGCHRRCRAVMCLLARALLAISNVWLQMPSLCAVGASESSKYLLEAFSEEDWKFVDAQATGKDAITLHASSVKPCVLFVDACLEQLACRPKLHAVRMPLRCDAQIVGDDDCVAGIR